MPGPCAVLRRLPHCHNKDGWQQDANFAVEVTETETR
jgi:hypothetical protein